MQTKLVNAYRITHKNGQIEDINATDLVQALENMEVPEEESVVIQTILIKQNIRTLIDDIPDEVLFTAIVGENGGGSIATPASGKLHTGDQISLRAIPARNYEFVSWYCNGAFISNQESLLFVVPDLPNGIDSLVFTANFKLSNVDWTTEVSPNEATGAGCIAFPESGTTQANGTLQLLAVEAEGYTFDHWERNGEVVGTNKLLETTVTPLADNELSCVYKAIFTEV